MPGTVYIIANATRVVQKYHARFAFLTFAVHRMLARLKHGSAMHFAALVLLTFAVSLASSQASAVPANYSIVNTVDANYSVNGNVFFYSASATVVTDSNAGNSPPSGIVINNLEIDENAAGAIISSILVEDIDPGDTHTYVVSDSRFEIAGGELKLVEGVFLDYEIEPLVSLSITATDPGGASVSQDFVVTVLNVNEVPVDIELFDTSVEANTPGANVGSLSTTDPDAGDTFTYSVVDSRFEIVGDELRLQDNIGLPAGITVDLEIVVTDAGGLGYSEIFVIETPQDTAPSEVEFLLLADGVPGGGVSGPDVLFVAVSQCSMDSDPDGFYEQNPTPGNSRGESVAVPATHALLQTGVYKSGESAFFRLNDKDANQDSLVVESVIATLSSSVGDSEFVRFFETEADSGVFAGYIQTASGAVVPNDCILSVGEDSSISIEYTDARDPADVSSATARVDPLSLVFESATGQPISGVKISIVDASTGQAVAVSGDGVASNFPDTMHSGNTVRDSSGAVYQFAEGQYRFPYLPAGQYKLLVEPPNRFAFPSVVADSDLQTIPGAPYQLSGASRGNVLVVGADSVFQVDIPLDLLEIVPTSSSLDLLVSSPGSATAQNLQFGNSQCRVGDAFQVLSPPLTPAGEIQLPATLAVAGAESIQLGDSVFVRVEDRDQDADPFAPDVVKVYVSSETDMDNNRDTEELLLAETGDSTGVFTGHVLTGPLPGEDYDCLLNAQAGDVFEVSYIDLKDHRDTSSAQAQFRRVFRVFDSSTGELLDGAQVTLIDVATGLPARVISEDGESDYPATVVSGEEAVDSAGNRFTFTPGEFRFPYVARGTYRLSIVSPLSYVFPSIVADDAIRLLPGTDYRLTPASRGGDIVVNTPGRPESFDVPLDPIAAEIFVSKVASKQSVAVGDFIQYQVSVENPHVSGTVSDLTLVDVLPVGFRLVEKSSHFNLDTPVEPEISSDGQTLSFNISQLGPQSSFTLRYVAHVTAGANRGRAVNSAYLVGRGVGNSNTATASVTVGEDLLQSKATVVGRVTTGGCGADATGFASARVFLEDGSYVLSDSEGRFHFEGLEPGTHVVQLDVGSLPESQQVIPCSDGNAFAGTHFSQFVDLQAGSLWRADFYLGERPAYTENVRTQLDSELVEGISRERRLRLRYNLRSQGMPLIDLKSIVMLPDELAFVPGSAQLNGQSIGDPEGIKFNALTFRMADLEGPESRELGFQVSARDDAKRVQIKAVSLFQADSKPVRTPVLKNTLVLEPSENWVVQNTAALSSEVEINNNVRNDEDRTHMQDFGIVEITRDREVSIGARVDIPELADDETPVFDIAWLALQNTDAEIVWPTADLNPRIPTSNVYVKHKASERVQVFVDGVEVNPLSFESVSVVPATDKSMSRWRNVPLEAGDNNLEVRITDKNNTLTVLKQLVHYSGSPIRAELVPDVSQLEADGLTPAVIAVKFYDRDGYPVRPGLTGSFSIDEPFVVLNQALLQSQIDPNIGRRDSQKYLIRRDGIAYIQLEPTTETGEVRLRFDFGDNRFEEVKAKLVPAKRDWVLVGFGEGSLAYNKLSGNMRAIDDAGIDKELGTAGRVAFYAKGKISGSVLMTIAYDSDKKLENSLGQQIDPARYYTLYGDGSEQRYDAQSQRKLYVKLENEEFRALFGDYDTSFDGSELSRYNRRFNGFKSEYSGEKWKASVFAAKTDLAHIRDELRGDGTSGVYHLSRSGLVANSESIVIETRDRFRSEVILSQKKLTRYLDYTIDYGGGNVIFKRPVYSQDSNFNTTVIIAEYEVAGLGQGDSWVAGGRLTRSFDEDNARLSATYVQDDTQGVAGKLVGTDLQWQVNDDNRIIAEVAKSDTQLSGKGSAYILQAEHQSAKIAGRAYFRQQDREFGMGQQNAVEAGTQKIGFEGEYRASEAIQFQGLMYKQSNLDDDTERSVAEMRAEYRLGKSAFNAGARTVEEHNAAGENGVARQLTLGASHSMLDDKLQLKSNAEIDVGKGNSSDFPTRLLLEADYELMAGVQLLAEQELSWAKTRNTSDSRLGIEAQPWTGANINTAVQRSGGENGNRLLSTTGVLQQWRIDDQWLFDVGFDRVHTLDKSTAGATSPILAPSGNAFSNTAITPVNGSFNNDFVAAFVGAGYRQENWDMSSRLEFHKGDLADKWNVLMGASHQLSAGRVLSASVSLLLEERANSAKTLQSDVRLGLAWRPDSSEWIFLNRLDWIYSSQEDGLFDIGSNKLVDNFNANWQANARTQLSLQLGLKYVLDQIDAQNFNAFTVLAGTELRYDLAPKWDIGMRASYLHSGSAENTRYSYGFSIGHSPARNLWLNVGYNVQGFEDEDFFAAAYTAKGPYLGFRFKVDQDSMRSFLSYAGLRSGMFGRSGDIPRGL